MLQTPARKGERASVCLDVDFQVIGGAGGAADDQGQDREGDFVMDLCLQAGARRVGLTTTTTTTTTAIPAGYRRMSEREAHASMAHAFMLANMTVEERTRYRHLVAWVVTREMATGMEILNHDEPISALSIPDARGIDVYLEPPKPPRAQQLMRVLSRVPDPDPRNALTVSELLLPENGLPLMPTEQTRTRYFVTVMMLAAKTGLLERGTAMMPELWATAFGDLPGLEEAIYAEDPTAALKPWADAWPRDRLELELFEEQVVRWAMKRMVNDANASHAVIQQLRDTFGLSWTAASGVVRMARGEASRMMSADLEENRALMVARIESYIQRSKKALDLDSESKGLKMLAAVQGLTRTDPATQLDEIVNAIGAISKEMDAATPPPIGGARITVSDPDGDG